MSKPTTTQSNSQDSIPHLQLSLTDLRKSPRRKRRPLSSSSKHSHSLSIARRFKAIFGDPIVGPMFHSFVALRPDFVREYRALQLLREIDHWRSNLGVLEKRSSSSSSSSASTGTINRTSRKHFTSIIQQFVTPGAPLEVRFALNGKDTVRDHLLSQEAKYVDATVFKSARRAILAILADVALEAFFDAACEQNTAVVPPIPSLGINRDFNSSSPVPTTTSSSPSSPRDRSSSGNDAEDAIVPSTGLTASARKRRPSASSTSATNTGESLSPTSPSRGHKGSDTNETKTKRRRSAPKNIDTKDGKTKRVLNTNSSTITTPNGTNTVNGVSASQSPLPPIVNPAPLPTSPSASGERSQVVTSARTQRLVMEIHELQFSSQESPGHSSPAAPTQSTLVTSSAPVPMLKDVTSPRNIAKPSGSAIFQLNQRYPALIPPMRTLDPTSIDSFSNVQELNSLESARRIVIVGGDFVAIELAAEIHNKYPMKSLILVHSHRHLLVNMGESVRLIVDNFFKNRNIEVYRKKNVVAIQPFKSTANPSPAEYYHILLDDGTTLEADKVFCFNTDYQHGNTSFLQREFGEFLDGRGFAKVDKFMRFAGSENIFALGDVVALNEYKLAERARAHASLVSANIQRILHSLELDPYRERPIPKTYDLVLSPTKGVQIENGRFVRIGPGPVERREFAERRVLHRFGALSLVLAKKWALQRPTTGAAGNEDETAGSRGETSSEASSLRSKKESRKLPMRRLSDNANEEDSDEMKRPTAKPKTKN